MLVERSADQEALTAYSAMVVSRLDVEVFTLVEEDIVRILAHIRGLEEDLQLKVAKIQWRAVELGVLIDESQISLLEQTLPGPPMDRIELCRHLLDLRLQCDPQGLTAIIEELDEQYSKLVEAVNLHTQYLEINVAGFRKLLKRHDKQIPKSFHARPTPFIGFHRLVTKTSQSIIELARRLGLVLEDARGRLAVAAEAEGSSEWAAAAAAAAHRPRPVLSGLGAECEMVLEIQRQLKDPMNSQFLQLVASYEGAAPGVLYQKPGASSSVPNIPDMLKPANGAPQVQAAQAWPPTGSYPKRPGDDTWLPERLVRL